MVIAFALALASVLMRDERTLLGRALSCRMLVAAGTVSYGIYLWHFLFIERLKTTQLWWTEGTNLVLVLALTLTVATVSWLVLEKPLLRVKDDLGSLRRARSESSRRRSKSKPTYA
jgi:peptidoglycan/LPS O-acetylase OafA/YrhL